MYSLGCVGSFYVGIITWRRGEQTAVSRMLDKVVRNVMTGLFFSEVLSTLTNFLHIPSVVIGKQTHSKDVSLAMNCGDRLPGKDTERWYLQKQVYCLTYQWLNYWAVTCKSLVCCTNIESQMCDWMKGNRAGTNMGQINPYSLQKNFFDL